MKCAYNSCLGRLEWIFWFKTVNVTVPDTAMTLHKQYGGYFFFCCLFRGPLYQHWVEFFSSMTFRMVYVG